MLADLDLFCVSYIELYSSNYRILSVESYDVN